MSEMTLGRSALLGLMNALSSPDALRDKCDAPVVTSLPSSRGSPESDSGNRVTTFSTNRGEGHALPGVVRTTGVRRQRKPCEDGAPGGVRHDLCDRHLQLRCVVVGGDFRLRIGTVSRGAEERHELLEVELAIAV